MLFLYVAFDRNGHMLLPINTFMLLHSIPTSDHNIPETVTKIPPSNYYIIQRLSGDTPQNAPKISLD